MAAFRPPTPRRVAAILRRLEAWHGAELQTTLGQLRQAEMGNDVEDPFEILIGTMLSHRTRDATTMAATKRLFARYPTAPRLARADAKAVQDLIYPVSFYTRKAPRVIEVARLIAHEHGGKVPDTMEALVELPGVGRKTAACVMVYGHNKPAIPVDTHVHRISNRLGLVRTTKPDATEAALGTVLPSSAWLMFNEYLVSYGKDVCKPIGPRCGDCTLAALCPSRRDRPPKARPTARR